MSVRVDRADPGSERDLADAAAMLTMYLREVLGPDEPATPPQEMLHNLRVGRPDIDATVLLAREASETVGYVFVDIRTGNGNQHMAWSPDLFVAPPHRRRGIGRRLLAEVADIAQHAGRTLVMSGYAQGHHAGEAFARATGARLGNVERQNRVEVAELDRSLLERWDAPAPGYSLVTFDGRCPDDLIDDVVALHNVMNDAPRSDSLGDFVFTAEQRRRSEAEHAADDSVEWFVAARHDATGELAGYTQLLIRRYKAWLVEQGDTAVAPAHRGHGIGRWVKAVNALRVLDELPNARVIETWNDGSNRWMLAINDDLGFRPVAEWVEAELQLP
jgi:GNAT superfamily N-acetyltransferase